jgi:alkanesulfonate monooxygenase SsuD/methylene tetrahydromethanopterin reductase-like flavin-dependent oxidoreductase (luciferase family)
VVPGLAADPLAGREDVQGAGRHEHHRHAIPCARCPRGGARHGGPPLQRQAQRGRGVRLDARGVRGRERLAHLPQAAQARARDDRDKQGIWTNDLFEYHGEFADFDSCGFGWKPVQKPHPPIFISGLNDPAIAASRVSKHGLSGWIGIQDTPDKVREWRRTIQQELEKLGSSHSIDDLEIASMIWFTITDEETDQTPRGRASNLLVGTAGQVTDNLKRLKEAGLTMLLIWPPFQDVPVSKTLDDLKRLKEEIMPKVEAM